MFKFKKKKSKNAIHNAGGVGQKGEKKRSKELDFSREKKKELFFQCFSSISLPCDHNSKVEGCELLRSLHALNVHGFKKKKSRSFLPL